MKMLINIPDEFEIDYRTDRFADFFDRVKADMDVICGNYERETADILRNAFAESKPYDLDKVMEQLEARTVFLKDCTKYGNNDAEQQAKSYDTMMMYEVADLVEDLVEIVKRGGIDAEGN